MRPASLAATGLVALGLVAPAVTTTAQQPKGKTQEADSDPPDSIQAIDKQFQKQHEDVERRRIEALANLAKTQSGEEAQNTYQHLFSLVILEGRVDPAEAASEAYLKSQGG